VLVWCALWCISWYIGEEFIFAVGGGAEKHKRAGEMDDRWDERCEEGNGLGSLLDPLVSWILTLMPTNESSEGVVLLV
jgi:hypothetical protein